MWLEYTLLNDFIPFDDMENLKTNLFHFLVIKNNPFKSVRN